MSALPRKECDPSVYVRECEDEEQDGVRLVRAVSATGRFGLRCMIMVLGLFVRQESAEQSGTGGEREFDSLHVVTFAHPQGCRGYLLADSAAKQALALDVHLDLAHDMAERVKAEGWTRLFWRREFWRKNTWRDYRSSQGGPPRLRECGRRDGERADGFLARTSGEERGRRSFSVWRPDGFFVHQAFSVSPVSLAQG